MLRHNFFKLRLMRVKPLKHYESKNHSFESRPTVFWCHEYYGMGGLGRLSTLQWTCIKANESDSHHVKTYILNNCWSQPSSLPDNLVPYIQTRGHPCTPRDPAPSLRVASHTRNYLWDVWALDLRTDVYLFIFHPHRKETHLKNLVSNYCHPFCDRAVR